MGTDPSVIMNSYLFPGIVIDSIGDSIGAFVTAEGDSKMTTSQNGLFPEAPQRQSDISGRVSIAFPLEFRKVSRFLTRYGPLTMGSIPGFSVLFEGSVMASPLTGSYGYRVVRFV